MIRVMLLDDHAALRQALSMVLERDAELSVMGQASSLSEAREHLEGVDVAVVDINLPDGEGLEIMEDLRAASPQSKVLILSASQDRMTLARAVEAGASGILHKSSSIDGIRVAIHRLHSGEMLLSANEVVELLAFAARQRGQDRETQHALGRLTSREKEVLQALAEGLNNKDIAQRIYISPQTQRTHMSNIQSKLGVHSQMQALLFALRHGVVQLP